MTFADSHAHLTAKEFDTDRDGVIQRARDAGVDIIVNPATDLDDSRKAVELADRHQGVYACVGIHPHEARTADEHSLAAIEELSRHPKVVAIGEIGLDFHYDFSPRDVQERAFRLQLDIARRRDLPVVVHTRESLPLTLSIVEETIARKDGWRRDRTGAQGRYPAPRGVFHCFPGDTGTARRLVDLGFFISFPGILTFKNAHLPASVAASVSIEHILLETDSPFMTPVPHRGRRNEPANIPIIAEKLASLQQLSVEDVARSTNYGIHTLFGIGNPGKPVITYRLRDALYVNLTIRCNADCVFCDRKGEAVIKGHNLSIDREPTAEEVIAEIGDPKRYREIVFCGFGEPTIRLEAMKDIARWVKEHGGRTRLNTDGHGSIINKRNIVPELVGLIDAVSVSLNSPDPRRYGELMGLDGERFFPAMLDFTRECVKVLPAVSMTIVDLPDVDREKAREIAEGLGARFVVRPLF
jgi:TatD DNase family protein